MFRAKALIFMIPLVLPIGQPPADASSPDDVAVIQCSPESPQATPSFSPSNDPQPW